MHVEDKEDGDDLLGCVRSVLVRYSLFFNCTDGGEHLVLPFIFSFIATDLIIISKYFEVLL